MMRQIMMVLSVVFAVSMFACGQKANVNSDQTSTPSKREVKEISQAQFAELICDWKTGEWNYKSTRPAVIDFNATWCGPCKKLAPVLQELAVELPDVDFYSVDIDKNPHLVYAFGVESIPMLLICPVKGNPYAITGPQPKDRLLKAIRHITGNPNP